MVVLRQEYVDAHVIIKTRGNKRLAVGIIDKIEEDILEIRPRENRELATLLYGLPITVVLQQKGCSDIVWGGVVYLSNQTLLVVTELTLMKEIEKRKYFRVDVDTQGVLSGIASPTHQKTRQMDKVDQKIVRLADVSLRGAKLITDHWLELGREYLLFFLLHKSEFTLCTKIVRMIALLDQPIEYGCLFIDVQDKEDKEICKCLYQIEAIERKLKVNMVEW